MGKVPLSQPQGTRPTDWVLRPRYWGTRQGPSPGRDFRHQQQQRSLLLIASAWKLIYSHRKSGSSRGTKSSLTTPPYITGTLPTLGITTRLPSWVNIRICHILQWVAHLQMDRTTGLNGDHSISVAWYAGCTSPPNDFDLGNCPEANTNGSWVAIL